MGATQGSPVGASFGGRIAQGGSQTRPYTHLHVHSCYSLEDGAARIEELVQQASALGMSALALTDHNSLVGAIRFYEAARAKGIKPILGAEVDMENGCRLVLLCKDLEGYHSLCQILSDAHLQNRDREPVASRDTVARYSKGLIALSGPARGELCQLLERAEWDKAKEAARWHREVFGEDFYIELTRYPGPRGHPSSEGLRRLAEFTAAEGLQVAATNNVHYVKLEDYPLKELRQAIWQNRCVQSVRGPRTVEQYLKSPQEMAVLFRDLPEAIRATAQIEERCNLELPLGAPKFPAFPVPSGYTAEGFLRELAYQGARERFPDPFGSAQNRLPRRVVERLEHELSIIVGAGFVSYFLVAWDIARFARERGIRFTVRGSAANSLVVYCLGMSHIDPLAHDLLFERFLHRARTEMPDIDFDFQRTRRDEVRDYIIERYTPENVAAVATISTYKARGVIRDVAKALGMLAGQVDEMLQGVRWASLSDLLELRDALPELRANSALRAPQAERFLDLCRRLDGFPTGLSVHLGGLVIGPGRLKDWAPLQWTSGGDVICQYDKDDLEKLGLIKMDCLMLPTLDVIEDAVHLIKETRGVDIDIDSIPKDDPETLELHRRADTIGCFQIESPAQREMAGRLLPQHYDDLVLLLALIRPGPMKGRMHEIYLRRRHGLEPVTYPHPVLEPALRETLGVIVYQEQVIEVAHLLAGMSYEEADGLRRGMNHDRPQEAWAEMKEAFIKGCRRQGLTSQVAEHVWGLLSEFASYGFPKGHSVAYAEPAYQTLWLRAHYLPEFLCALLNNQPMGYYPARALVMDARNHGIPVLPLDVNKSQPRWTVEGGDLPKHTASHCERSEAISAAPCGIATLRLRSGQAVPPAPRDDRPTMGHKNPRPMGLRVGLRQLKGMTEEAEQAIVRARASGGEFQGLRDFVARTGAFILPA